MRSIETVRWTVSVPGCVPSSAEARRANLAVSASVVTDYVSFVAAFFIKKPPLAHAVAPPFPKSFIE